MGTGRERKRRAVLIAAPSSAFVQAPWACAREREKESVQTFCSFPSLDFSHLFLFFFNSLLRVSGFVQSCENTQKRVFSLEDSYTHLLSFSNLCLTVGSASFFFCCCRLARWTKKKSYRQRRLFDSVVLVSTTYCRSVFPPLFSLFYFFFPPQLFLFVFKFFLPQTPFSFSLLIPSGDL